MTLRALSSTLLLLFWLVGPAWAQTAGGFTPPDTEVYLRVKLFESHEQAVGFFRRLSGIPAVKEGLSALAREAGVRVEEDLLGWSEGVVVLAEVRDGEASPLRQLLESGTSPIESVRFNLQTLYNAVEMYQLDHKGLPSNLEALIPDYLEAIPAEPAGVTYRLEVQGPEAWRILSELPPDLAGGGPAPFIDQSSEVQPPGAESETGKHLNLVLAAQVTDPARARAVAERWLPRTGLEVQPAEGGWSLGWMGVLNLQLSLGERWLVLTDTPSLAGPCLASLEGKAPDLTSNPRFQDIMARLPSGDLRTVLFVDGEGITSHLGPLPIKDPVTLQGVLAIQAVGSVSSSSPDRATGELFVRLNPPAGHPLADLLASQGRSEFPLLSHAPWSTSYFTVADLEVGYDLAGRVAGLDPETLGLFDQAVRSLESHLGLSIKNDILPSSTGEIGLAYESFDTFYYGVRKAIEEHYPQDSDDSETDPSEQAPEWVPEGENPTAGKASLSDVVEWPYTFVIGLKPGSAREELVDRLRQKMGNRLRMEDHHGVDVYHSLDDKVCFASYGNYLILSLGSTGRLLEGLADGMVGRTPPLSRLESYDNFFSGRPGHVILASHQKVDDVYSILKAMMLTLGADFRPEATALGRWRDSYSVVTVEPEGIRIRGAVYATEQVP